jgi:hypothetical protein
MGISAWLDLITAALKFPAAIMAMVKLIQATPAEQHDALVVKIQAETENMKKTGRPTW